MVFHAARDPFDRLKFTRLKNACTIALQAYVGHNSDVKRHANANNGNTNLTITNSKHYQLNNIGERKKVKPPNNQL